MKKSKDIIIKTIIPVLIALLASVGINIVITKNNQGELKIEVGATIELSKTSYYGNI